MAGAYSLVYLNPWQSSWPFKPDSKRRREHHWRASLYALTHRPFNFCVYTRILSVGHFNHLHWFFFRLLSCRFFLHKNICSCGSHATCTFFLIRYFMKQLPPPRLERHMLERHIHLTYIDWQERETKQEPSRHVNPPHPYHPFLARARARLQLDET